MLSETRLQLNLAKRRIRDPTLKIFPAQQILRLAFVVKLFGKWYLAVLVY